MKNIIKLPIFVVALATTMFFLPFFACKSDKNGSEIALGELPNNSTYVNMEMLLFTPATQVDIFEALNPTFNEFFSTDTKHGVLPIIGIKSANNDKLFCEITHQITPKEIRMGKKDDPHVHRTRLMDLVRQAKVSQEFAQPFEVDKDKLLKYWQQLEKPKSGKAFILYNAESEDSSTVHSPEELKQRLIEVLKNGKYDISILYNIQPIENKVKENLVIQDIDFANQSALELKSNERKEQLEKIESSINKQLIEFPTNQCLLFERVVNRTYAAEWDKAMAYLQMAAKQALSSGIDTTVFTLKNKLELEGAIKLKMLKANRAPLFDAVLNGLTNRLDVI
jgi:hypothetical protein